MLELVIKGEEAFNANDNTFTTIGDTVLHLEHSLLSVSKWEEKYCKPFLDDAEKTKDETQYYIECMILDKEYDKSILESLTSDNMRDINDYISSEHTATKIYDLRNHKNGRKQTITSELIYYWMIVRGIPIELESWNINRLLTLMRVYDIEQEKANGGSGMKMPGNKAAQMQRLQNAKRKAHLHSRG